MKLFDGTIIKWILNRTIFWNVIKWILIIAATLVVAYGVYRLGAWFELWPRITIYIPIKI